MPRMAGAACTVAANPTSFGVYDSAAALPLDATGNVAVTCSGLVGLYSYTIQLDAGSSGSYLSRQMFSVGNTLNYNLYSDVTRLIVWGDGTGGTATVSGIINVILFPVTNNHAVYGRIPTLQNVPAGSYVDTITVTVNY